MTPPRLTGPPGTAHAPDAVDLGRVATEVDTLPAEAAALAIPLAQLDPR